MINWYLALYLMYLVGTLFVGFMIVAATGDWSYIRCIFISSVLVPFIPIGISARNYKKEQA